MNTSRSTQKHTTFLLTGVNEIRELGNTLDIVCTAFAYGYMKGAKIKKGGAAE